MSDRLLVLPSWRSGVLTTDRPLIGLLFPAVCLLSPSSSINQLSLPIMAFRSPFRISRQLLSATGVRSVTRSFLGCGDRRCGLATAVPPVTQDVTGSKGPTAMVFLNMGGPSTTGEVEDFLSRLFVCSNA